LAETGFQSLIAPVMSIEPVDRPHRIPRGTQAILITSRNALGACPPDCRSLPLFAVGDATAALANQAGFEHVVTASGNAMDLAELVLKTINPTRGSLYLPTGYRQGLELANRLRLDGYRVFRHVGYKARPVAGLPTNAECRLRRSDVRAALFFSAETARHFVRLIRAAGLEYSLNTVDAVSISERATMPLRQLAWRRIRVAAKPDQNSMLALLQ
jgi:uroporphyrinogen-III synthase